MKGGEEPAFGGGTGNCDPGVRGGEELVFGGGTGCCDPRVWGGLRQTSFDSSGFVFAGLPHVLEILEMSLKNEICP